MRVFRTGEAEIVFQISLIYSAVNHACHLQDWTAESRSKLQAVQISLVPLQIAPERSSAPVQKGIRL